MQQLHLPPVSSAASSTFDENDESSLKRRKVVGVADEPADCEATLSWLELPCNLEGVLIEGFLDRWILRRMAFSIPRQVQFGEDKKKLQAATKYYFNLRSCFEIFVSQMDETDVLPSRPNAVPDEDATVFGRELVIWKESASL